MQNEKGMDKMKRAMQSYVTLKKYQVAFILSFQIYFRFVFMAEMDFIIYIKDHEDVERHCQFEYLTNGDNKVASRYQNHHNLLG